VQALARWAMVSSARWAVVSTAGRAPAAAEAAAAVAMAGAAVVSAQTRTHVLGHAAARGAEQSLDASE
jgi:hypothetical protein